jgi:hypothetical protein
MKKTTYDVDKEFEKAITSKWYIEIMKRLK